MKVWFQLFLGDAAQTPFKVTLNQNADVADLIDAVKIKCGDDLQGVSPTRLRVYPPGTQVPVPEGATDDPALDPGDLIAVLNWGSRSKNAFVIIAPAAIAIGTVSGTNRTMFSGFIKRKKSSEVSNSASTINPNSDDGTITTTKKNDCYLSSWSRKCEWELDCLSCDCSRKYPTWTRISNLCWRSIVRSNC